MPFKDLPVGATNYDPIAESEARKLSLCGACNCVTKTIKGNCGKCGEPKQEECDYFFVQDSITHGEITHSTGDQHCLYCNKTISQILQEERQETLKEVEKELKKWIEENRFEVIGIFRENVVIVEALISKIKSLKEKQPSNTEKYYELRERQNLAQRVKKRYGNVIKKLAN